MRTIAALTAFAVAALVVLVMRCEPNPGGRANVSVTGAVDTVVGTSAPLPVQLVRRSHGGGGHHHGGHHHRGGHHRGPYFFGGIYGPYYGGSYNDGEGYYQEGDETCVWNGYEYRCYKTYGHR
jgi:hypothetical protein